MELPEFSNLSLLIWKCSRHAQPCVRRTSFSYELHPTSLRDSDNCLVDRPLWWSLLPSIPDSTMQSIGVVFIIFILAGCGLSFVLDATNNPVAWSPAAGLALTSLHPGGSAYSSLCWNNTIQYPTMSKTVNQDWSPYKALYFSMYNNGLGTPKLMLILDSDTNRGDYDYYSYSVSLDWTGWKNFIIPLSNFNANRSPAGWNTIQKMYFSAVGWGLVNNPLTQVSSQLLIFS